MTSVSHADYDRLLLGSPLRRRPVCIVICVALLVALSLATLIHLGLLASMRLDDQPKRSRGRPPAHPCRCPVGVADAADGADGADARATFPFRAIGRAHGMPSSAFGQALARCHREHLRLAIGARTRSAVTIRSHADD